MFVKFNFDTVQLSPTGTKVKNHDKLENRLLWDSHGTIGWYIGPAMENYIVHQLFGTNIGD